MLALKTILLRRCYANGIKIQRTAWQCTAVPLALLLTTSSAWPLAAKSVAQAKPLNSEESLMWEVSGNGITQPSYLFGTIHINCQNKLQLPIKRLERFAKTTQLYLELDFDDPGLQTEISKNIQMPPGRKLQQLLTPQEYQKAQKYFSDKLGLPLDFFSTTKPFILTALATPSGLNCPVSSWEESLTKMAQQRKMEVRGLETVKEQFAVFDQITLKEEAAMLMEVINNPEKSKQEFLNLLAAYEREDLTAIEKLSTADPKMKKLIVALLDDRNRKWLPIITREAKTKSTFFGVGAAHLVGQQGVIALLKRAGYKVKPVSRI